MENKETACLFIERAIVIVVSLFLLASCKTWQPSKKQYLQPSKVIEGQLHARYMGATTLLLSDGSNSILFDGFFTRKSVAKLASEDMVSEPKMVSKGLKRANLNKGDIDALFVAHNHYDHALDAFNVARWSHTTLYAPQETLEHEFYASEQPLSEQNTYNFGHFSVKAILTPHVDKCLPIRIVEKIINSLSNGEKHEYAEQAFSFLVTHRDTTVLIVPSARFKPVPGLKADVVFLGVGLLGTRPKQEAVDLWQQAVKSTGASLVIPVHWDDITKPIETDIPAIPWYADNLGLTMKRLNAFAAREPRVHILFPPAYKPFLLEVTPLF